MDFLDFSYQNSLVFVMTPQAECINWNDPVRLSMDGGLQVSIVKTLWTISSLELFLSFLLFPSFLF